jgi:acyl carrier protein
VGEDEAWVDELRALVRKHAKIPVPSVGEEDILSRDLGYDSLGFLLLLSDLEARLGVAFPLERVDELERICFGQLAQLVLGERRRLGAERNQVRRDDS